MITQEIDFYYYLLKDVGNIRNQATRALAVELSYFQLGGRTLFCL